jgi:hypothetical protein
VALLVEVVLPEALQEDYLLLEEVDLFLQAAL